LFLEDDGLIHFHLMSHDATHSRIVRRFKTRTHTSHTTSFVVFIRKLRHLLFFPAALVSSVWAEDAIRSASELRALTPEMAARNLPAEMEVVVTFVDRVRGMLFVHDGIHGFYVIAYQALPTAPWLDVGRRMRLRGNTGLGEFLPVVAAEGLQDLGPGTLPQPRVDASTEAIMAPKNCSQWAEVEGVVKRVAIEDNGLVMSLQVGEQRLPVELPKQAASAIVDEAPRHLLERRVRVRGVAATQFNHQRQMSGRMLYLPSLDFLTELENDWANGQTPLRRVDELLLGSSPLNERVRLRGVVLHAVPEQMLFLRGEGGSMRIDSALTPAYKPGTLLEVEGEVHFHPFRPRLTAVALRELGQGPAPEPVPMDPQGERRSEQQFELVTVETTYVDMMQSSIDVRLLCRSGDLRFEAKLPVHLRDELKLEPWMRLRLTGVCELELDNPYGIARFTKVFTISLRSAKDVVVLEKPPYWTSPRLLVLLAVTGGTGLLFAVWSWMLRKKVREQSEVIERQTIMRATLDERHRIARELHDTLEQELSGVAILLDTSSEQIETGAGEPKRALDLARQLLKHSREESRSTIRDLRSVAIEQLGLVGVMEQILRPLAERAGMVFRLEVEGVAVPLKGSWEAALLRVSHEAVANAAKHSHGRNVKVKLCFMADVASLEVCDDGVGFRPEIAPDHSNGHFGLTGMRERARRIGAELIIHSREGGGTCVQLIAIPSLEPGRNERHSPATLA
jgi:signal transduction histidine kinase